MGEQGVAAGYFRVSVARDNMSAPQIYKDEITRYCAYKQLTLATIYSDIDHSAFRGAKQRPGLAQLVAERDKYCCVVVPKLARFGRSVKELVALFETFDADGIPLVFLDMNLDTCTSQGRLLRHILAAFAEYESDVKADYARANHRRIRAEGRPWGQPPYGYRRAQGGGWEPHDKASAVVRAIYSGYVRGASANAIAARLNEAAITTARGLAWRGQAIGKILDNPAYAALSIVDGDLMPARWEPIVSRRAWDAVRARRACDPRRVHNLGRTKPHTPYLLSGLLWCGQCGRRMTHTTARGRDGGVYHCHGNVWGSWQGCRNARIFDRLADDFVAEQFIKRCAFTILTDTGARTGCPTTVWAQASIPERQRLLKLVVEKIVASPLETTVPKSQYRTRLRHELRIWWKTDVARGEEVVVVAQAPQAPARRGHKFTDGRYQMMRATELAQLLAAEKAERAADDPSCSWAQWRRAKNAQHAGHAPEAEGTWAQWRRARLLPP